MFGLSTKWDDDKSVAIIGAGFGGIVTALRLKKLGITNFTIYEKASEVGGTWRDNAYPGCSVDVSADWYSISSEPNPNWSETYAGRDELWQYQKDVVARNNLRPHIRLNSMLVSATWDDARQGYELHIERTISPKTTPYSGSTVKGSGEVEVVFANVIIQATGGSWSVPKFPTAQEFPGLDDFKGEVFHSAAWRADVELKGKRVGVIGNGATAAQIVPVIAKDPTTEVINIARNPQWFIHRSQASSSRLTKWLYGHVPLAQWAMRLYTYCSSEVLYVAVPNALKGVRPIVEAFYVRYLKSNAPERYHEELMPKISLGCRRVIRDPHYYSSLTQPNVSLEWSGISRITPTGLLLDTGKQLELDVLVMAIGFKTSAEIALPIRGRDGTTLRDYWESQGGPTAWGGTTVPNFPNHWMLLGPNSGAGHASVLFYEEVQVDYAMNMIKSMFKKGSQITSVELKADACDQYNAKIQKKLVETVWATCSSYYNQHGGKNVSLYPGFATQFWWQLLRPNWNDYIVKKIT